VEIRYPDDSFEAGREDAREARDAAAKVLRWLEGALPALFQDKP
jgi:hypothetical protein